MSNHVDDGLLRRMRLYRLLVLGAIVIPLILLKFSGDVGVGPFGTDAAYYFQIARNIAEGKGLVTNVSLYHQALDPLPQMPEGLYPLWPLILGYSGKAIGMFTAVSLLPRLLYVVDLLLLYLLANRIAARWWGRVTPAENIPLDLGHLAVLLLGSSPIFFSATTHPYTEGAAFAFAFSSLIFLDRAGTLSSTTIFWAAAAGSFAGLAFLCRPQMIMIGLGSAAALLWIAISDRRLRWPTLAWSAAYLIFVAPWFLWIRKPSGLTRAEEIERFSAWYSSQTSLEWLSERLQGLTVSFSPASVLSYTNLYSWSAYLVVVAAVVALIRLARTKKVWEVLSRPDAQWVTGVACLASGIAFFLSLNLYHAQFWLPWLFGWRHGLPLIFLLVPCIGYLIFTTPRLVMLAVVLTVLISAAFGMIAVRSFTEQLPPGGPALSEVQALRWIEEQTPSTPVILTTRPQELSTYSRAHFHWTECGEPGEKTRQLLEMLPIDYVLMYGPQGRCPAFSKRDIGDIVRVARVFGSEEFPLLVLERLPAGQE